MSCWFNGVGPAFLLPSCAISFAKDGALVPAVPGGSAPSLDYLLYLGPYGALVCGDVPARQGREGHDPGRAVGRGAGVEPAVGY